MKRKYIISSVIILIAIISLGVSFYPKIKRNKESKRYALSAAKLYGQAEEEMDLTLVPQAIKQYKESLRINPENASALVSLGAIYTVQDKDEDALTLYKKAVKIKPRSVRTRRFLARQYRRMGMDAEADNEYRKILELDPDDFSAQLHFGMIEPEKDVSLGDLLQNPEIRKMFMFAVMQKEAQEKEKEEMEKAKKERDEAQKKVDDILDEMEKIAQEMDDLSKTKWDIIKNWAKLKALADRLKELGPKLKEARDAARAAKENYDQKVKDYIECLEKSK